MKTILAILLALFLSLFDNSALAQKAELLTKFSPPNGSIPLASAVSPDETSILLVCRIPDMNNTTFKVKKNALKAYLCDLSGNVMYEYNSKLSYKYQYGMVTCSFSNDGSQILISTDSKVYLMTSNLVPIRSFDGSGSAFIPNSSNIIIIQNNQIKEISENKVITQIDIRKDISYPYLVEISRNSTKLLIQEYSLFPSERMVTNYHLVSRNGYSVGSFSSYVKPSFLSEDKVLGGGFEEIRIFETNGSNVFKSVNLSRNWGQSARVLGAIIGSTSLNKTICWDFDDNTGDDGVLTILSTGESYEESISDFGRYGRVHRRNFVSMSISLLGKMSVASDYNTIRIIRFGGRPIDPCSRGVHTPLSTTRMCTKPIVKNRFALIIGNEAYTKFPVSSRLGSESDAKYSINDASYMKKLLESSWGIGSSNIVYGVNQSKYDITSSITELHEKIKRSGIKNPEIVFFYTGHGYSDNIRKLPFIIPVGSTAAMGNEQNYEVQKLLADIKAPFQDGKMIAIIDACFSGQAKGDGALLSSLEGKTPVFKPSSFALPSNTVCISSTSNTQVARLYNCVESSHFTYSFVQKLTSACNEGDNLGAFFNQLSTDVSSRVQTETGFQQTPTIQASPELGTTWQTWLWW